MLATESDFLCVLVFYLPSTSCLSQTCVHLVKPQPSLKRQTLSSLNLLIFQPGLTAELPHKINHPKNITISKNQRD